MSEQLSRENAIFEGALLQPPEQRDAYLREACGQDTQLLARIQGLLKAHENTRGPLDKPAFQPPEQTLVLSTPGEQPGDKIGAYKILQLIGEGGWGSVFMAEQEQPVRRRVALKILKLGLETKGVIARFEAERQALALMDHPNIAKVFDAGATATGRPYFVMEMVRGIKITEYCDRNNLTTAQRLELFVQVCKAIQHAHQKGIIHRDIKPSNILVALHDGMPVPKVIDFGIAKATNQRLTDKTLFTEFQQIIGTPAYMSPEQAEMSGLDIDTRSDIYSLGVLLYELLTSRTPFDPKELLAAGLDAMRRLIREQEPPRPSTRLSTMLADDLTTVARQRKCEPPKLVHIIRGDLDWIVMKALEKDRTRRYETASTLAGDVDHFLNGEPVVARPPTLAYRAQKLVRRNKLAFAALGAIGTVLMVGSVVSTCMYLREREARREAVAAEQHAIKSESRAVTEAVKSRQVAELLKSALQGVGPSVALGRDTKMLQEIMDDASQRISAELTNQPEVEGELRATIGEVYLDLGQLPKAEETLRKALTLRESAFGSEHTNVATSLDELAAALMRQDKFAEAENRQRAALAMRRKLLGDKHPDTATSMNNLGLLLWQRGHLQEAESLHRETLALRRKLFGPVHPDVANSLNNLGIVLRDEGNLSAAEQTHREALELRRKLFGENHTDVAVSLNNLASALWDQHRFSEAEAVQRQALAVQQKIFGNEHPDVANSLNNLATDLYNEGNLEEAQAMERQALALQMKLLGHEHEQVARSVNNLGYMLWQQGKLSDAEVMHRDALAIREKLLGHEHVDVAQSLCNLGLVLRDEGKFADAEQYQRESLKLRRKLLVQEDPNLAASVDNLSVVLADQGKFGEAEQLARECLAIRRVQAPDDWVTFNTESRLGGYLLTEKNFAQAEPLLLSGYEGLKLRQQKIPAVRRGRIKEAAQRLVQLFQATDCPAQAKEWEQKLTQSEEPAK